MFATTFYCICVVSQLLSTLPRLDRWDRLAKVGVGQEEEGRGESLDCRSQMQLRRPRTADSLAAPAYGEEHTRYAGLVVCKAE